MAIENPPAFPSRKDEPCRGGGSYRDDRPGMTLRDWFAGQALTAVISATSAGQHHPTGIRNKAPATIADAMARDAYDLADAMLRARSTDGGQA